MAQQFTNNARALLVAGVSPTDTSIVIESAKADLFPVANVGTGSLPSANNWFKATLQDANGNVEIVAVRTRTAGSGILANVIRGYEGTTALAFVSGTVVGLRITAADVQAALSLPNQNNAFTGDNTFAGLSTFNDPVTFTDTATFGVSPTAPTPTAGDNSTKTATTAFVAAAVTAATGSLGTMSTQNANNVSITGGAISGLGTAIPVPSGGTGAATLAANSVLVGNGTSAVQTVAPGASGNVLASNGTAWVSQAPQAIATGGAAVSSNASFTATTGSTGKCLITLHGKSSSSFGNFGDRTIGIQIGGSVVASTVIRTIEWDGRLTNIGASVTYMYTGAANSNVTVTYYSAGAGNAGDGYYSFVGT